MDDDPGPTTYAVWWNARWTCYGLAPESSGPTDHDDVLLETFFASDWKTAKRMSLDIQTAHWVKRPEFLAQNESSNDPGDQD